MRVVYFANNRVGLEVLRFLRGQGADVVALVVHPREGSRFRDELVAESGLPADRIIAADRLRTRDTLESMEALAPDLGLSVFFGYILRPELISLFPRGVLNVHPAYLPYNRGSFPNVWSIVDRTPAGATIHYIDPSIDTGDIVSRTTVPVLPTDTGESLYRSLEDACIDLFAETWPKLIDGTTARLRQSPDESASHRIRDVEAIDRIDLDSTRPARELIDVIRARTFAPHPGAYFEEDGEKIYLRLQLLTEDQLAAEARAVEPDDAH